MSREVIGKELALIVEHDIEAGAHFKEGVIIFDIASMQQSGASTGSGDAGQVDFVASIASHKDHHHVNGEAHGGG